VDERARLIQVVGDSGSGKTLVVERSVRALVRQGLRVAVVKHSHHAPDLPGKDSERAWSAGASLVVFSGRSSLAHFGSFPPGLIAALPVDVVLIEGFSGRRFSGSRYSIRAPSEVSRIVRQILSEAPTGRRRTTIVLDGSPRPADPVWDYVLGVMSVRGVRTIRRDR
jgi:molybdopterin-guanine dinucleotide biosynthesis protein MobB